MLTRPTMHIATSRSKSPISERFFASCWRGGLRVFQADFQGSEREVSDSDAPLDFGVGTLFVNDPDGNLIEFVQLGHGIFTPEMQPRMSE